MTSETMEGFEMVFGKVLGEWLVVWFPKRGLEWPGDSDAPQRLHRFNLNLPTLFDLPFHQGFPVKLSKRALKMMGL